MAQDHSPGTPASRLLPLRSCTLKLHHGVYLDYSCYSVVPFSCSSGSKTGNKPTEMKQDTFLRFSNSLWWGKTQRCRIKNPSLFVTVKEKIMQLLFVSLLDIYICTFEAVILLMSKKGLCYQLSFKIIPYYRLVCVVRCWQVCQQD